MMLILYRMFMIWWNLRKIRRQIHTFSGMLCMNGDGCGDHCRKIEAEIEERRLALTSLERAEREIQRASTDERIASTDRIPSLRDLQLTLSWSLTTYSSNYLNDPRPHRNFAHALLHILKAAGKLSIAVDNADHGDPKSFAPDQIDRFLADVIVSAVRAANECPGRVVDLDRIVIDRIKRNAATEMVD